MGIDLLGKQTPRCCCSSCRTLIPSDGYVRYFSVAQPIMSRWGCRPRGYSLVGPLAAARSTFFPGLHDEVRRAGGAGVSSMRLLLLAGISVMWQGLRKEVAPELVRKFALLLIAASMFPNPTSGFFRRGVAARCWSRPDCWPCSSRHRRSPDGSRSSRASVNTPATLAGLVATAVVLSWRTRRLRHFLPVAIAAGLIVLESWIRRGMLFSRDYLDQLGERRRGTPMLGVPGFSYPLFFGLLSVLFSFGKELVFYAQDCSCRSAGSWAQSARACSAPTTFGSPSWSASS